MKNMKMCVLIPTMLLLTNSLFLLGSCSSNSKDPLYSDIPSYMKKDLSSNYISDRYKNYYQVLVHSFRDSNGDGIGDLQGLISKLDYLNAGKKNDSSSLGIDGLYTLPIFESNTYHKYDVKDYYSIDSDYGTMDDFDQLVAECKNRGISIILDLPINHTSSVNSWFVESKKEVKLATASDINDDGTLKDEFISSHPKAGWYNWKLYSYLSNQEKARYRTTAAKIDTDTWYYEAYFDSAMPDLNLSNTEVQNEIKNILKFWFDKGVYGFRLDGVEHYYDSSKADTYDFCNKLYQWCYDIKNGDDFYLVGEGPWSSDVADYYSNTKIPSYMNFYYGNYPYSSSNSGQINRIFMNEQTIYRFMNTQPDSSFFDENGSLYSDEALTNLKCNSSSVTFKSIINNWNSLVYDSSANPNADTCVDANFLSNHDTVREMNRISKTKIYGDEETCSSQTVQRLKLAWAVNHLMKGCSFTYYGEEIGMVAGKQYNSGTSDEWKNDPNKRHPMYWSTDSSAEGMVNISTIKGAEACEQYLGSADEQINDSNSLWNFFREIYKVKSYYPEIARGTQSIIYTDKDVAVMSKEYNGNTIYLVYNFSKDMASIDLSANENLAGKKPGYVLSSTQTYSKIVKNTLNVPSYSVTILK